MQKLSKLFVCAFVVGAGFWISDWVLSAIFGSILFGIRLIARIVVLAVALLIAWSIFKANHR